MRHILNKIKGFLNEILAPRVSYHGITKEQQEQADKMFKKADEMFDEANKLFKTFR